MINEITLIRIQEILKFYGDKNNYERNTHWSQGTENNSKVVKDEGVLARTGLDLLENLNFG